MAQFNRAKSRLDIKTNFLERDGGRFRLAGKLYALEVVFAVFVATDRWSSRHSAGRADCRTYARGHRRDTIVDEVRGYHDVAASERVDTSSGSMMNDLAEMYPARFLAAGRYAELFFGLSAPYHARAGLTARVYGRPCSLREGARAPDQDGRVIAALPPVPKSP